jgi:hypothetical protein
MASLGPRHLVPQELAGDADKQRHGSRLGYSVGYSCRGSANALAARIPFQDARTAC